MTDEQLNNQLYEFLCASVLKWFETDRAGEVEITINKMECCKNISYHNAVIGDTIRNASFTVSVVKEPLAGKEPMRCYFGISIKFRDEIHAKGDKGKEFRGDVLKVVNQFNIYNHEMCCLYDERVDTIEIRQHFYFYPGSHPADNEIAKILDDFYFHKDIEGIAELVETGGWRFPDEDLFIREIDLCHNTN